MNKVSNKKIPDLRFPQFRNEWSDTKFADLIEERSEYTDEKLPLCSLTIEKGVTPKTKRYERSFLVKSIGDAYKAMHKDDFAYNPMNLRFGAIARYKGINKVLVSKYYNIFKCNGNVNPSFFEPLLKRTKMLRLYNRFSTGTLEEKKRLHFSDFLNFKQPIPDTSEQTEIASFLNEVDSYIEGLKSQKVLLQKYRSTVRESVLSQEINFSDDKENSNWRVCILGDFIKQSTKRNKDNNESLVLSVSNSKGFIAQTEQFENHRVASKETLNYKLVERGDVAYNPSRINVGSIAILKNYPSGIVSPMYVVFKLSEDLHPAFFEHLITTSYFKHLIKVGCSGSVRDSLSFEDLAKFKIKIPNFNEQIKIASFLDDLNTSIELIGFEIDKANLWKSGLLQKMFV